MSDLTMADVETAMSKTIDLASSVSAKTGRSKALKFYPVSLSYKVVTNKPNGEKTSTSFKHPQDAVDYYNSFNI